MQSQNYNYFRSY